MFSFSMFGLCAGAFVAGAVLTWLPMRATIRRLQTEAAQREPVAAPVAETLPEQPTEPEPEAVVTEAGTEPQPEAEAEVVVETVVVETAVVETPVVETPAVEAPVVDAPVHEAPVEAPVAESAEPASAEDFPIKGSSKSMIFHTETSPYFRRMKGDVFFRSVEEAEQAGYTMWAPRAKAKVSAE